MGIDFSAARASEPGFVTCSQRRAGRGSRSHASAGRKEHQRDEEETEDGGAHVDVRLTAGAVPADVVSIAFRTPSTDICTTAELL